MDPKIRKLWCKVMRRDKISSKSHLHCCEDHFNIEEDTKNYMEYNIMKQQGQKVQLQLKKGAVPHIFQCQKQNMPPSQDRTCTLKKQRLTLVNEALSESVVKSVNSADSETSQTTIHDAGPSTTCIEYTDYDAGPSTSNIEVATSENYEPGPSTSHIGVLSDKLHSDKYVQVNIKSKYRSKGVQVNVTTIKKSIALSPLSCPLQHIGTSPFKSAAERGLIKRKLFINNAVDTTSSSLTFSSTSSTISHEYEQCNSSELSWVQDESEDEKDFKNVMRSSMLTAIEKNPKIFLGLPKQSYHLIKLLSNNISLPTLDILITLKKIKLNDSFNILAVHFGYSQSTISRIYNKSLSLIALKMKELIVWPTPTEIHQNLPISFRARYANVISIIDCLEIQIEKPSNAVHQSLTWSNYKQCNTLKYLISCTPDGLITFISDGYGGRATDVAIVKDCGYLDCLPPNKAVMADRGFKGISCLLEARKCTLVRPPSVSKSTSSSKEEVKESKRIAALRIHVERVISRLREFNLLLPHACVDNNLITTIDDVIITACGLVNMQDVIIKK